MKKKHLLIGLASALGAVSATFISLFVWKSVTSGKTPAPKPQVVEHFITFESIGGEHIPTQRVKDGEIATKPKDPKRGEDTFLGWFTDFEEKYTFTEPVTKDITLYAGWEVIPEPGTTHSFKFTGTNCSINGFKEFNCNITIGEQPQFEIVPDNRYSVPDNITVVKGQNVYYTKENGHGYIKIANMTSDVEITAVASVKTYTVTWLDYDGKELKVDNSVEDNTKPVYEDDDHPTPTRESDAFHDYTFVGWSPTPTEIHCDMTYVATYDEERYDAQVYMKVNITEDGQTFQFIYLTPSEAPAIVVDWGDGNSSIGDKIGEESQSHTYARSGEYDIRITGCITTIFSVGSSKNFIKKMYLGSTINYLLEPAFKDCSNLTSVIIASGITDIGHSTFENCSNLQTVTFEKGSRLISTGNATFNGCSSLTSINIPSGVTSIGNYTFNGCSALTSITIPSGVTAIGGAAFNGCFALTSITIPSGVTEIGWNTFNGCLHLQTVTFEGESQLTYIDESAFNGCSSLTSINIPSSVTSIGWFAFQGCSSLTTVDLTALNNVPTLGDYAFSACPDNFKLYVNPSMVEAFKSAEGWKEYAHNIVPGPVPSIN